MNIPSRLKKIRNTIFYWCVLFIVKILRAMPRRSAIALLRTLARITFPLAQRSRNKTIKHLTMAYENEKSPEEIKAIAKDVFLHFFTVTADFLRLPVMIRQDINKFVTVEGIEHLDKAIASTKTGIMMLTAHFGNWELLGAWLAQNGYPMRVVGMPLFDPRLDKILVDTRNKAGYTNIARGSGTRGIIRSLREGYPIGMLIDQDTNVQGIFVTFFGRPTYTPTGPLVLARKFNVPVVPIFMRLSDDFTYHIECKEPVNLEYTDNEERDLLVNTQKCSDVYEEVIRKNPEQWAWIHKRWKTQPEDIIQ